VGRLPVPVTGGTEGEVPDRPAHQSTKKGYVRIPLVQDVDVASPCLR